MAQDAPSPIRLRMWLLPVAWLLAVGLWAVAGGALGGLLEAFSAVLLVLASVWVCVGSAALMATWRVLLDSYRNGVRSAHETLETMMVLAEHSRRNGIIGLADVETNWVPLGRACQLVATAADDARIRAEAVQAARASRLGFDSAIAVIGIVAAALVVSAGLIGALGLLQGELAQAHGVALALALVLVAGVCLPALGRLVLARNAELVCLNLAFEGALKILHDNSLESVYRELSAFVPGGLVASR